MKHKLLLLVIALVITVSHLSSQSLEDYFYKHGVYTVAQLAHPTSTLHSGSYDISHNGITVNIQYTDGVSTSLFISQSNGFFTTFASIRDSDWWPPFNAVGNLKDLLLLAVEEMDTDAKRMIADFESFFGRSLYDFSGEQTSILLLNLDYFDYLSDY